MKYIKDYVRFYENMGSPLLELIDNVDLDLISKIEKNLKAGSKILEISRFII